MKDEMIRQKIHRAVDVHGASLREDPYLAQRILASSDRKEAPRMKKLSTGAIIAIVLMLLSVTALAVGLTVEQIWQQSYERMNTTSNEIRNYGEPTDGEITLDEALAIARKAIQDAYGTSDAELDSMGLYPTFFPREKDDGTWYPSKWEIWYSSVRGINFDSEDYEYDLVGDYRVYINGETGEVTYCGWYTNDFWVRAQIVWDQGNYDEVAWEYGRTEYFQLPREKQDYWTKLLAEKGYEVIAEEERLHTALSSARLELLFNPINTFAPEDDPQVQATWQALAEQRGLDEALLKAYAYVVSKPQWNTGYDDVVIHYSYELEWNWMETGLIDSSVNKHFSHAKNCGMYMVSFEKGTTNVAAVTHMADSESPGTKAVTEGPLLARTDWTMDDLRAYDNAVAELAKAVRRMKAANLYDIDIDVIIKDFYGDLGMRALYPEYYPEAPEDVNAEAWFSDETALPPLPEPSITAEEAREKYGLTPMFWPLEVQYEILRDTNRQITLPQEGEMTYEEALAYAIDAVIKQEGQEAIDKLGDYVVGCNYTRYIGAHYNENTMWYFYIADKQDWTMGWRVLFVDKNWQDFGERHVEVNDIFEEGVG